ncbi:MAG: FeoB-associated Cys-rich membrane protein [Candidatus Metalachnospira sp.]|nr:FeoB-associated Cys-rich membrane protein [Candidatus Metalachnospira sp.]
MSLLDWILVAAVIIGLYFAVRHIIKHKGGCSCSGGCSGNCSSCTDKCKKNK